MSKIDSREFNFNVAMSDNSINNSFNSRRGVHSLNSINKDLANQNEKISTGKKVNSAEKDSISISKSAKLRSQIVSMEQTLASTHSEMKEDRLANELISLASANSTIIDTDMAKEQSENIRQFILQNTATASMAQANLEFGKLFKSIG